MRKLYIIGEGDGIYELIADDGEYLASHWCSSKNFAEGDLEANRPERKAEWKKRFGEYQVLFLGDDDMTKDELIKRNKSWDE